jgi:hypothetical protein
MAFNKPTVKTIKPDLKNVSIYIRSVKKFGKSTLFRDVIMEKYGDPTYGCLAEIGMEHGDELLDNLNTLHLDTYKDLVEFQKWLIEGKGTEHHIEIVGFDVADELVPLFDKETIRQHNIENPQKPVKSVKAAMGGYTAGEQYSATLMKNYFDKIRKAGIQVWVLGHSKYKNIKDKANVDNEGYMQLTSNLSAAYEAALGDIFDVVVTGMIDRNIETVGEGSDAKRYATDSIRKLYFRGTPEIDAGGRFAFGAVPEYLVFDKPNMAKDFIKIIEDGMEKSKTCNATDIAPTKAKKISKKSKVEEEPAPVEEDDTDEIVLDEEIPEINEQVENEDEAPFDLFDEDEDIDSDFDEDAVKAEIRPKFRDADAATKKVIKGILNGSKLADIHDENTLKEILKALA